MKEQYAKWWIDLLCKLKLYITTTLPYAGATTQLAEKWGLQDFGVYKVWESNVYDLHKSP